MTMVMMITASPKTSQRILEVVALISMNIFMEIGVWETAACWVVVWLQVPENHAV